MTNIITIPTPCYENWEAMTPQVQGRHCDSCSKTVIDFTTWQPQKILYYFKQHKNICGRFTEAQLNTAILSDKDFLQQMLKLPLTTIKRVAAIFLFAFMISTTSCAQKNKGQVTTTTTTNSYSNFVGEPIAVTVIDTTKKITGKICPKPRQPTKKGKVTLVKKPIPVTTYMGDTIIIPNKTMGAPIIAPVKQVPQSIIMGKMVASKNSNK